MAFMLDTIRKTLAPTASQALPAIPEGQRIYAIGDVHGRLDLLQLLRAGIEQDNRRRGPAATTVVLLGDLVDRGPDSAGVIAYVREWQKRRELRVLCGNHEEMFLAAFDNLDTFRHFMRFGGRETVESYGVASQVLDEAEPEVAQALMRGAVPESDRAFLQDLPDYLMVGDYLFVHAGVRPGAPIAEQSRRDLRWIRKPFLESRADHGCVVVHGHTITDRADLRRNRIGIDTGAYLTSQLTALGLEGTQRWLIETQPMDTGHGLMLRPIKQD